MVLWLVRSSPDGTVRARVLAGNILLSSWSRHFTLTVPLSTHVYKWVPANCWQNLTCDRLASRRGEVEILLAASCYRNGTVSSGSFEPALASRLHFRFFFTRLLIAPVTPGLQPRSSFTKSFRNKTNTITMNSPARCDRLVKTRASSLLKASVVSFGARRKPP